MLTEEHRVVVTGIGVVTSIGIGISDFWNSLIKGKSGIKTVTRFNPTDFPCKIASEVNDFDPTQFMDLKEVKRNDRYTHFALAASKLAISDAKLNTKEVDPEKFGVLVGSGIGGLGTIEKQSQRLIEGGPRKVSPFMIPGLIANIASGVIAIEMGARGPNFSVVSACAGGTHSIGEALKILRSGHVDVMLAGGSEATITPLGFAGFCAMKAMSTSYNDFPSSASRPFNKTRDGFIMGEGSGILVLETLKHAKARKANIYCEIIGYGATCDAYHITSPDPEGKALSKCFKIAIKDANILAENVDYINAHGTSTQYNDKFETLAIKKTFSEEHLSKLFISSTKSMTGHLLGAAGGIEAAACVMTIKTGVIPPTINYENNDSECNLNYVPNESIKSNVNIAISDNLGFGGHNAAIVFKKFEKD